MRGFEARSMGPMERRPKGSKNYYIYDRNGDVKRTIKIPQKGYDDEYDCVGGEKALYFNFEYLFPDHEGGGHPRRGVYRYRQLL